MSRALFLTTKPTSDTGFISAEQELDLIARAQRGDGSAKAQLVEAFQPLIRSEAKRFARHGGHMKSDDVAQEVTIWFLEAVKAFDPHAGRRLATIAKTIIQRRLPREVAKQEGKVRIAPFHDPQKWARVEDGLIDSGRLVARLSPEQRQALDALAGVLARGIHEALTPEGQKLIRVHYYDDSPTVAESAHRLGITRPTFYKRRCDALAALQDFLAGEGIGRNEARVYHAILHPSRRDECGRPVLPKKEVHQR